MFGREKKSREFFESLCEMYYEKILRYLHGALGDESAARDCTQEVFLTACGKSVLLAQHPNPGGFLFQTAKNLARRHRRESFARMAREQSADERAVEIADNSAAIDRMLDAEVDEQAYIDLVLDQLSPEKRRLYRLYYVGGRTMAQIAAELGIDEAALRMRYVRLRREIRGIAAQVAD